MKNVTDREVFRVTQLTMYPDLYNVVSDRPDGILNFTLYAGMLTKPKADRMCALLQAGSDALRAKSDALHV